jgi:hypothetical protein
MRTMSTMRHASWLARCARVAREEALIPFRQTLARDIVDVRNIVGSRYNEGMRKMIRRYRHEFPHLMRR